MSPDFEMDLSKELPADKPSENTLPFLNDSFFSHDFDLMHKLTADDPRNAANIHHESAEQPGEWKDVPSVFQELDHMRDTAESQDKDFQTAIDNLEQMRLEENGRTSVVETREDGVIHEVITRIENLFRPEGTEQSTMRDIDAAAKEWHRQETGYSCAVACQQFILNEYTGGDVSEAALLEIAETNGWYNEAAGGTPTNDIGKLLEMYGIDTDINKSATYQDLRNALSQDNRVIVGVNNLSMSTEWADGYPIATANHAIEVIGIDESDPENVRVIVNDPGVEDGCAKSVSLENFIDAWNTSGGYMMTAYRN